MSILSITSEQQRLWQLVFQALAKIEPGFQVPAVASNHPLAHLQHYHPEMWIPLYEQAQEKTAKRLRKEGLLQNGVFYTPKLMAHYLIQQTLGKRLQEISTAIHAAVAANNEAEIAAGLNCAKTITVIDPACGTGVFLFSALQAFQQFYQSLPVKLIIDLSAALQFVLEHQLYGIDIDPHSIEICRSRLLWGLKNIPSLSNIQCGNTLNPKTLQSFPTQHWTFIVGNPPYISEVRKQASTVKHFTQNASYYQAKMDLCDAFLDWSMEHLQEQGQLAYVLPAYWTQRSSTKNLRQKFIEQGQFKEYWDFPKAGLFKNAPGHHSSLIVWEKGVSHSLPLPDFQMGRANTLDELNHVHLQPARYQFDASVGSIVFGNAPHLELLHRLSQQEPLLQASQIQQGVILPQGRLKATQPRPSSSIKGLFLLTQDEVEHLALNTAEKALLKPYFTPIHFKSFTGFQQEHEYWLVYTGRQERKLLDENPTYYPNLIAHLKAHQGLNTSAFSPYGLHRPRQIEWFEKSAKILTLRQTMSPAFSVVKHPSYVGEGFYIIQTEAEQQHYLTALLNSSVAHFWFYHQKRKGDRLQVDKDVLCTFPKPTQSTPSQILSLSNISKMLHFNQNREQNGELLRQLNNLVFQLYGLSPQHVTNIQQFMK